jgi:hypothetical protein
MENMRRFFSIFEVRGGNFFFERGVTQIWSLFYCKTENISFFLLKLKILEAKVKFWCDTHMTEFFLKKSWSLQNFRRERTVFHFIFNENVKSEAVFQHFWSARRQFFFERGVSQIWSLFFIAKQIICLAWIKEIA